MRVIFFFRSILKRSLACRERCTLRACYYPLSLSTRFENCVCIYIYRIQPLTICSLFVSCSHGKHMLIDNTHCFKWYSLRYTHAFLSDFKAGRNKYYICTYLYICLVLWCLTLLNNISVISLYMQKIVILFLLFFFRNTIILTFWSRV